MDTRTATAAIFDSLKGSWHLRRSLNSVLPGFPSGIFEGVATFKPRKPTAHSTAGELLYSEQGELRMENGNVLKAKRKYIYRYDVDEDTISAWFVKEDTKQDDGNEEVDYLFHDLEMESSGNAMAGRGEHLCELDMYWAYYEFRMPKIAGEGEDMNVFGVRYKVKGPQKDYTSDTAYERTFTGDITIQFEDTLLRCYNGKDKTSVRQTLFDYLPNNVLRCLRTASRPLKNMIDHEYHRIFRRIYMHTPLKAHDVVPALEAIGPFCQNLTIEVGYRGLDLSGHSKRAGHRTPFLTNLLAELEMRERESTQDGQALLPVPEQHPEAREIEIRVWGHIFRSYPNLTTLTLCSNGNPGWPGQKTVEKQLLLLRIALERSAPPRLHTLILDPMHIMGILHLRWCTFGAFIEQPTPNAIKSLYHSITTLCISLHNPELYDLTPNQTRMSVKIFHSYLRSFAPTLSILKFVYLGSTPGPSPLALDHELGMEDHAPIQWPVLREFWFGNITLPYKTIALVPERMPNVKRVRALRSAFRGSIMVGTNPDLLQPQHAWMDFELHRGARRAERAYVTSSLYSISDFGAGEEFDEDRDALSCTGTEASLIERTVVDEPSIHGP